MGVRAKRTRASRWGIALIAVAVACVLGGPAHAEEPAPASEPAAKQEPAANPEAAAKPEPAPEPPPPADPWATFAYVKPAPVYRLRLAIEEVALLGLAMTGYLIHAPEPALPQVPPMSVWDKIRFAPDSWYLDSDELATNFVGHPSAGTFYYMFARANRVSFWEAFLWAVGTSTVWELIEFKEPVAINDMIVTPAAGLAIGEGFTQLSSWFDRGNDALSKAFAWIFDPMKKIHDWMDGSRPLRDPEYRGWHEFRAEVTGGLTWQGGVSYVAAGVNFSTRLFRAPGYGEAGGVGYGFSDGNVSAIGLSTTFAGGRTLDFLFETETAMVGYYARDIHGEEDLRQGWDAFVGATAAFESGSHVWDLQHDGPKNQIAQVRIPGVDARARLFAGAFELDASLDVAMDFAGVEPLGAPGTGALGPGQAYPTVYPVQGYYFALGLHLAPAVEARYGIVALGASLRSDLYWGLTGPFIPQPAEQVVSLSDSRSILTAWVRVHVPEPSVEVALRGIGWERQGKAGDEERKEQEASLLATFAVVF